MVAPILLTRQSTEGGAGQMFPEHSKDGEPILLRLFDLPDLVEGVPSHGRAVATR